MMPTKIKVPFFASLAGLLMASASLTACEGEKVEKNSGGKSSMQELNDLRIDDMHSFAKPEQAQAVHLDLSIEVNFDMKKISGTASYLVENKSGANHIIFDTRDLDILNVTTPEGDSLGFQYGEKDPILGQALEVELKPNTNNVVIEYATRPGAAALQWLSPQQTAGKQQPFLFTQSQAILARTWLPCQDGPGMRFTYNANVRVPKNLMAVMSATNPTTKSATGDYEFHMAQPIPAYLMALAVGDLQFKKIGERTGVYAEPSMLDCQAWMTPFTAKVAGCPRS
jgi:aminopeptidase N